MVQTFASGDVLEHPQLNNMIRALAGDGVVSGYEVVQRASGGANMSVDVPLGRARIANVAEEETGLTNLPMDASHATLERKDLITYDASGDTPAVIKGTDHAGTDLDPTYPPNIPAGDILLAIVKVGAAATSITNGDITDCRVILRVDRSWMLVSDRLQASDDAIEAVTTGSYLKYKELTIPANVVGGGLRVSFAINETGSGTCRGKIYRNGVALGAEKSVGDAAYATESDDYDVFVAGDTVELWAYTTSSGNVKELRVYCEHVLVVENTAWA